MTVETPMIRGRTVYVKLKDNPNSAYKRLHRLLKEEGVLDELRAREAFVPASTKRRTARSRGTAREMKRQAREAMTGGIRRDGKHTGNKGKNTNKKALFRQMMQDLKDAKIPGRNPKKGRRKARSSDGESSAE
jgi:ribosomal protein S21